MSSQTFKNAFDFLAGNHQVVNYDQHGSSNSQLIADNLLYTIDQSFEELKALRRDVLQCETMVLVGFERSGHWPYLEEPERFQQVLNAFLAD